MHVDAVLFQPVEAHANLARSMLKALIIDIDH